MIKIQSRAEVEKVVRESVYRHMGLALPRQALAPSQLLVNVSARHCHVTQEAVEILFGKGHKLTPMKDLYQPGAFAAKETVTLVGPRSRIISNLRILGPCRTLNQVELAFTDAVSLGFDAPIRPSGSVDGTPGCMLMGPAGFFEMKTGVIRAAPHVHMAPADATFYKVKAGDFVKLRVHGPLGVTFDKMLVRIDPNFKLEIHIDTDEGNACGLSEKSVCEIIV